jgi:hypothetical protein
MGSITWWILALVAAACGAGLWAWQRHRVHLAEIRRQLAWSEASRFQLEEHARDVDQRLAAMSEALQSQQQVVLQATSDAASRRAEMEALLDRAAAAPGPAPAPAWADTLPMGPAGDRYADTLPAPLTATPPGLPRPR